MGQRLSDQDLLDYLKYFTDFTIRMRILGSPVLSRLAINYIFLDALNKYFGIVEKIIDSVLDNWSSFARPIHDNELAFIREILGETGVQAVSRSIIVKTPDIQEIKDNDAAWDVFYIGIIWLREGKFANPLNNARNTFIHEVFHQVQYFQNPGGGIPFLSLGLSSFDRLIIEQVQYSLYRNKKRGGKDVYDYDLSRYTSLNDFQYYESQAQMVGDFAEEYHETKLNNNRPSHDLIRMAEILQISGYNSEAITWVLSRNHPSLF